MTDAARPEARPFDPVHPPAETRYATRRDDAAARRDALARRAATVSNLRLLAFATGVGALVWAELQPERGGIAFTLTALAGLAFFALIAVHSRLTQRRRRAAEMAAINEEGIARLRRDWDALPSVRDRGPAGHPYARDLDIFGHGSLLRLLGTAGTGVGQSRLREWLLGPTPVAAARRRQEAVRELVPMLEFRQDLQVAGRLAGEPDPDALVAFLDWAEAEPWLLARPWLLWLARVIPAATLVLLVLHIDGVVARPWWILTLIAGVVLAAVFGKAIHRVLGHASLGDANLRVFAGLVRRIQDQPFESEPLREVRASFTEDCDAHRELDRLAWLTELADLRHSGLFYVLLHVPTLWDFHVLWALERWQRRAGRHVRAWVDRVADIDALSALASPALDEPGWSLPDLEDGPATDDAGKADAGKTDAAEADPPVFVARGLAHPLLAADDRVPNDISLGPPGTFVMVTGSNMSGKSTLLRAIGVNAVLAQAGGPVCAHSLRIPPLTVRSSMRVEDSLERGVSLFMAELERLKQVVDAAQRDDGRVLLYLLDEVLHGTNTAERQVAIRKVVGHLLERRAIGAISTHDLELADAELLRDAVVPVHFRETVHPEGHDPPMSFDYRLREGIATSTNALKLVRLVGLA